MSLQGIIQGFSKLSREDQVKLLSKISGEPAAIEEELNSHRLADRDRQDVYDSFSENTVSNYFLPYSIAPNFRIDDHYYFVPMVTDESSVVAAAAASAKFWSERGGFHTKIHGMNKPGHIHFTWNGSLAEINTFVNEIKPGFYESTAILTRNMKSRDGGILDIRLIDLSHRLEGYYQVEVIFNTADSMGANFINSCLEKMASFFREQSEKAGLSDRLSIIMSILSNYTPQCRVECLVQCDPGKLSHSRYNLTGYEFARKFELAVNMARHDIYRAVTQNKGIFNGIDAVIMATGNDFRAIEAGGHAFASRDGMYRGLTVAELLPHSFTCRIDIPMNLGTLGGLTRLHPLARVSMNILGNPDTPKLMSIAAAAGLANNFSAIRALITGGIQQGHMQMHLSNLLLQLKATPGEIKAAIAFFRDRPVTHASVEDFLIGLRNRVQQGER